MIADSMQRTPYEQALETRVKLLEQQYEMASQQAERYANLLCRIRDNVASTALDWSALLDYDVYNQLQSV